MSCKVEMKPTKPSLDMKSNMDDIFIQRSKIAQPFSVYLFIMGLLHAKPASQSLGRIKGRHRHCRFTVISFVLIYS